MDAPRHANEIGPGTINEPAQLNLARVELVEQLHNLRNWLINLERDERRQPGPLVPAKMKHMSTIEGGVGESDYTHAWGSPYRANRAGYNLAIGAVLQREIGEK